MKNFQGRIMNFILFVERKANLNESETIFSTLLVRRKAGDRPTNRYKWETRVATR